MGRKKLDFNCKCCNQNTEVMHRPIYVASYNGYFCNMDCYAEKKKQENESAARN